MEVEEAFFELFSRRRSDSASVFFSGSAPWENESLQQVMGMLEQIISETKTMEADAVKVHDS